jgi:dTMP kinase
VPERGFFITFEGIDGSGKSSQARRLAARLSREGYLVAEATDPGTTALGERIRGLLLERSGGGPPEPWAEVALFLAARVQLLRELIEPGLATGAVVISDRYLDSTLAYQGSGRGLDQDALLQLHRVAGAGLLPDLTLLLDLPVEAAQRRFAAALPLDRMEAEPTAYHERVRQGYLALAQRFSQRIVVLPANPPAEELAESCWGVARERLAARRVV